MDWTDEVKIRLKRKNSILFSKNSEYLQDLAASFQTLSHRITVLWAFKFASESAAYLEEKYPEEKRPGEALAFARGWAAGAIKMRQAQRKILDCHAFAKEIDCKTDIALCHAVGQACAAVHSAGHAIGYPVYDLTSIVYRLGVENCREAVESRKQQYIDRLSYWERNIKDYKGTWAAFMLK